MCDYEARAHVRHRRVRQTGSQPDRSVPVCPCKYCTMARGIRLVSLLCCDGTLRWYLVEVSSIKVRRMVVWGGLCAPVDVPNCAEYGYDEKLITFLPCNPGSRTGASASESPARYARSKLLLVVHDHASVYKWYGRLFGFRCTAPVVPRWTVPGKYELLASSTEAETHSTYPLPRIAFSGARCSRPFAKPLRGYSSGDGVRQRTTWQPGTVLPGHPCGAHAPRKFTRSIRRLLEEPSRHVYLHSTVTTNSLYQPNPSTYRLASLCPGRNSHSDVKAQLPAHQWSRDRGPTPSHPYPIVIILHLQGLPLR